MKSTQSKLSRRNFLLAAGVGSVAATAALVAPQGGDRQSGQNGKAQGSQGYRLTEHIRNYYRTAKV
jgi:hypothetical protein